MAECETDITWDLPQCQFRVEFAGPVLEQVNSEVCRAFYSVPRGGAEIGGILYGTRERSRVRIVAAKPLECEHAFGPSFTLSERDLARLSACLKAPAAEAAPARASVVGWYHSHTRGEICLTEADLAIHREFFPYAWQIAIVLRPAAMQPTRLGLFYRRSDGSWAPNGAHAEFVIGAARVRAAAAADAGATVQTASSGDITDPFRTEASVPARRRLPLPVDRLPGARQPLVPPRDQPATKATERRPATRSSLQPRSILLAVSAAICLALAGLYIAKSGRRGESGTAALALRAVEQAGQLHIVWNRDAVADAVSGVLRVHDGSAVRAFALDRDVLEGGSIDYRRQSEVVSLSLTLVRKNGAQRRGTASYAGSAPAAPRAPETVAGAAPPERRAAPVVASAPKPPPAAIAASPPDTPEPAPVEPEPVGNAPSAAAARPFQPPVSRNSQGAVPLPPREFSRGGRSALVALPLAATAGSPSSYVPPREVTRASIAGHWTSRGTRNPRGSSVRTGLGGSPRPEAGSPPPHSGPVYPPQPPPHSGPVYPPELVEVYMSEDHGEVFGSLVGRYRTPGASGLERKVSFTFRGPQRGPLRFPWTATNGSTGQIELYPAPGAPDTVRIIWRINGRKAVFDHMLRRLYSY